jgi:xylulokinase
MYTPGYDVGSSSMKAALLNAGTGKVEAGAFSPKNEMPIITRRAGPAEQDSNIWWKNLQLAASEVLSTSGMKKDNVIGIFCQMHGLVIIDKNKQVLRPSIME